MVRSIAQSVTGVFVVIVAVRRQLYRMANSPNNDPKIDGHRKSIGSASEVHRKCIGNTPEVKLMFEFTFTEIANKLFFNPVTFGDLNLTLFKNVHVSSIHTLTNNFNIFDNIFLFHSINKLNRYS